MSLLPEQCAIAFKEWSEICQVLADGRQTLIVRKGGIREGPGGFSPDHRRSGSIPPTCTSRNKVCATTSWTWPRHSPRYRPG